MYRLNEFQKMNLRTWWENYGKRPSSWQSIGVSVIVDRDCFVWDVHAFKGQLTIQLWCVVLEVGC